MQITDEAAPGGRGGRLVVRIDGPQEVTLMAELRGHGQYACLLGHGRGELPEDWAPHPMTRAEWEALADRLRAVSDTQPSDRVRRRRDSVPREPAERDWDADPPLDTGDVLARALVEGRLSWLDVLDESWSELGATPDGWSLWLRPDYGSPPSSESSANGCELRGVPSLTMHSTAVPWADGEVSYSPAEVLALSGRLGTTDFATAMRRVEMAAAAGGHRSLPDWPVEVLAEVAELVEDRLATEAGGRLPMQVGLVADWEDEILDELGTGATAGLFRRGDELVHVPRIGEKGYLPPPEEEGKDGPAQVRVVDGKRLRFLLGRVYWLFKLVVTEHGSEKVHVRAPGVVCDDIAGNAHAVPGLRVLRGVVHAPFLRADGSLLAEPGYDEATGVLYLPTVEVPEVPEIPTDAEVVAARELVAELLVDFPFVTTHDRANILGLLMLPLLREIIEPPWPLAIFNAHQMGSGKTLLGKLLMVLHDGVLRTKLPNDDDEIRKSLTALLYTTTGTVVVFDNQVGVISSGELANLLTSAKRSDRKLGETQELALTNDRLFAVTGNNVQLGGDMPRRGLWVSIDPGVPRPWERTEFEIAHLEQHVRDHRGELLAAMLTLCRHWVALGMPLGAESRSDDYGRLVSVMHGLLPAVGIEGVFMHPVTNLAELGVDDDEWATFLAAVHAWSAKAAPRRSAEVRLVHGQGAGLPDQRVRVDAARHPGGRGPALRDDQ